MLIFKSSNGRGTRDDKVSKGLAHIPILTNEMSLGWELRDIV